MSIDAKDPKHTLTLTGPTEPVPIKTNQVVSAKCTCGEDEFVFEYVSGPGSVATDSPVQALVKSETPGDVVVEAADDNQHVGRTTVRFFGFPADA